MFSGACKQLPGLSLHTEELNDEEFQRLENYLIESAYNSKEVYNVRSRLHGCVSFGTSPTSILCLADDHTG